MDRASKGDKSVPAGYRALRAPERVGYFLLRAVMANHRFLVHNEKIPESRFTVKPEYRQPVVKVVHNERMESAGKRIKDLRKSKKLTQGDITDATGIPQSTQSDLENGKISEPSSDDLLKLARYYEVEPAWILTGKGPKHTVHSTGDGESELLLFFRSLSTEGKQYLLARARDLHAGEHEESPPSRSGRKPERPEDERFQ